MANTNTEIIAMLETNPSQAIRGVLDTLYLYNPATVNDLIEKLNEVIVQGGFEAIVVDTLPETGKKGTIYFVPSGGKTPNVYNEYVWVTETEKFEMVGSAQVDLSNYYTKEEVDNALKGLDPLPDQTDNAGKFLMTDGTTASWQTAIRNLYPYNYKSLFITYDNQPLSSQYGWLSSSVVILSGDPKYWTLDSNGNTSIVISGGQVNHSAEYSVTIGYGVKNNGYSSCVAIGYNASTGKYDAATGNMFTYGQIAIGASAKTNARYAIQIGKGTNNDAQTLKISNEFGNYEYMSADGTIPTDRYTTTPTTAGTYVPKLTIAEDGTATREWGTASSGGAGGDYLPLSGGTLTGELGLKHPGKTYETKIYMAENGVLHFQSAFEVRFYNSLFPNSSTAYNAPTLGLYSSPWKAGYISKLHTQKLNNGADIAVPTEGGTLARLEDLNEITTVTIKEYD